MEKNKPAEVKYIKLGQCGEWEAECIESGFIKFGYHETPHELCLSEKWDEVREVWKNIRNGNEGTATKDANQIKAFYTARKDTVFITFFGGFVYWCRPTGGVSVLEDGSRVRQTVDGWHNQSIGGKKFTQASMSGQLYKTQAYRGTICNVSIPEYVIRKINDELSPEVEEADFAETAYLKSVRQLCSLLTWQDFELLIDLIFSTSGWRRTGSVGETQKTVDLELELLYLPLDDPYTLTRLKYEVVLKLCLSLVKAKSWVLFLLSQSDAAAALRRRRSPSFRRPSSQVAPFLLSLVVIM